MSFAPPRRGWDAQAAEAAAIGDRRRPVTQVWSAPHQQVNRTTMPASTLVTEVTWVGKISWRLPHDVHSWSNISGPPRLMCTHPVLRASSQRGSLTFQRNPKEKPMLSLHQLRCFLATYEDRKSVVQGKSVDRGGRNRRQR